MQRVKSIQSLKNETMYKKLVVIGEHGNYANITNKYDKCTKTEAQNL